MTSCLLCSREVEESTANGLFFHAETDECLVRVTDRWGISLDHKFEVVGSEIYRLGDEGEPATEAANENDDGIEIVQFYPMEKALLRVFEEQGLQRLGGRSSGSGWSNVSLFQKCPYAWKRRYLERTEIENFGVVAEIEPLAIGSLVHTYLALYYQRMIVHDYPLVPEYVNQQVRVWGCNPKIFEEAWRLFVNYRIYYQHEEIMPLAVEFDLRDPRTNDSCRYDVIAFFPKERPGFLPGTYVLEHKTAGRFDANTLEAWHGDGEVLGQVLHWDRLHLDRRFGRLRGVIVNLLGKQKEPQLHRTLVAPTAFTIEQHREDLRNWNGKINYAKAMNDFPRSRNNCIRGFMRCEFWDHCNSGE